MKRTLVVLGCLCVALGAIGIVVPGMPTTCFLLLASWLFARSSPRLHRRLLDHRRLGAYLRMAETGAMPLRAKRVSLAAMWLGIGASLYTLRDSTWIPWLVLSLGLVGTAVLTLWVRSAPDAVDASA